MNREIIEYGIDRIDEFIGGTEIEAQELHYHLYNEDYFIIGTWKAYQFLNEYGTHDALRLIQEYENDNFGEVNTDLGDAEKVAGMVAYIEGERALNECETLQAKIDNKLNDDDLRKIQAELELQLKGVE